MAIFKNSRYTGAYVFSDELDREIIFLDPLSEPKFSPSQDDLLIEISQGDRLDLLAERFYGDPALDWVILECNPNVRDPFGINVGDIVRVPIPEKVSEVIV